MRTENDAELIQAYAKRDDQGAFAEIVSRHGAMVFRVCFRKLTNRHDAEDATQAVFMALIKNSEKMHWKDSLAGYTTWTEGQPCSWQDPGRGNNRGSRVPLKS